ncbi:hypothetical protein [Nocardia sp. NPDC057353]|uniref:hypothetical protein n=1 Tax=Nocardia sp. NPDC057353 TaxID=3346104 RepID=UPI00363F240D
MIWGRTGNTYIAVETTEAAATNSGGDGLQRWLIRAFIGVLVVVVIAIVLAIMLGGGNADDRPHTNTTIPSQPGNCYPFACR